MRSLSTISSRLLKYFRYGWILVRYPLVRRRLLIGVGSALICLYAISVLSYTLLIPDIGLLCAFSTNINRIFDGYICPASSVIPQEGDTITQLGDSHVETWPQLLRQLIALRHQLVQADFSASSESFDWDDLLHQEDLTHIRVEGSDWVRIHFRNREGATHSTWCRIGRPPIQTLAPSILWFFLKVGLLVVGALVFWKRTDDPSATQFFLLCITTIGAYMGGYHWSRIVTQPVLLLVFMVCGVFLPAVSLHFYLVFPRPKQFLLKFPRWTLWGIYAIPGAFLFTLVSGYLLARWLYYSVSTPETLVHAQALQDHVLDFLRDVTLVYFGVAALWYLASVICLIHSYRNANDLTQRNQVKWILFGALAALVPIGYSLYLAFWKQRAFGAGGATWPMFAASACFTVAFAVSITRYRLMQLDQLISSGVVYFLISFLAGLVYYALVFVGMLVVGSQVIPGPSVDQALWVCSTAMVLLLILDLARNRLQRALDRHFRREKHQLDRTLQRMSQAIEQLVDPQAVARRLLHASVELLGVPRGAVYLRQGDPPLYSLADSLGPPPALTELTLGCPLVEFLQHRGTLMLRPRLANEAAQRQLQFLRGALAHPLVHEGQMLALLVLGPKDAGAYGIEDVNLLAAFAQITVLALVSAEGHRTIEMLNHDLQTKVEKIAEQQRRILALQSQLMKREDKSVEPSIVSNHGSHPEIQLVAAASPGGIIGSSPQIRHLLHLVRKVSVSSSEVLIRGESGTGKELLAQALHETSPRASKPFIKVHCASLSPGLLESELFGHVKGAFTGAHRDKVGRFEMADSGTLFLDEIGDINLDVQTKLLRVLQEMVFERVGSSEPVSVDVRVIAATHQNLEKLMEEERFRKDLYYRLNVITMTVPPLRERREDIAELVQHFLRVYSQRCCKDEVLVDDDTLAMLKAYSWPGNIRQLENVIERAVVFAEGPALTLQDLPSEILQEVDGVTSAPMNGLWPPSDKYGTALGGGIQNERAQRDRREREQLVRALAVSKGNKAEAARVLGLARSTLISRLKKHGLQ